jgi:hypothetical protein
VADFCEISAQSPAQRPRARQNETLQIAEGHERPAGHKRAIQEWMGHADAKTTEIYRHYAPDPTHGASFVERAFGGGNSADDSHDPSTVGARV